MSAVVERSIDTNQQLWFRKSGVKTEIGFTEDFLAATIRECWHVTPASKGLVKEQQPLLTVELMDQQFTIPSPVHGNVVKFNADAMNFPDQLTTDDVVCVLSEKAPEEKPKKKVVLAEAEFGRMNDWNIQPVAELTEAARRPVPAPPPVEFNPWGAFEAGERNVGRGEVANPTPPPAPRNRAEREVVARGIGARNNGGIPPHWIREYMDRGHTLARAVEMAQRDVRNGRAA